MNFLTHSAIAVDVLPLAGAARDLSIVGAVAPDLSGDLRLRRPGPQRGRELLESVRRKNPGWIPFALGLITHGNDPAGVDAASHGPEGIISSMVRPLVERAKDNADFHAVFKYPTWWHLLTELVFDYLLVSARPEVIEQVRRAFHDADLERAAEIYAKTLGLEKKTVSANFMRLRKWNLDYYLDAGQYHFIFHRVRKRLKRPEKVPKAAFNLAFETARKEVEPRMGSIYESLLLAARGALEAVDYRGLLEP